MRDPDGLQGVAQRPTHAQGAVVRAPRCLLGVAQRRDDRHRFLAPGPPRVEEAQRLASFGRRRGHQRGDLMIERAKRPFRRVEVRPGARAFRLDARELDCAFARGGKFARIGKAHRAHRVVAAHRRLERVGGRSAKRSAMS